MLRVDRWLVVFGAAILVLVLALAGLLTPALDAIRFVTLPVVRLASRAAGSAVTIGREDRATRERIEELEARLTALSVDYVRLRALEEENRSLRAQARFLSTSGYDSVGARVISREISGRQAELLVDRGRLDYVEIGQAVVTNEGVLIGKVSAIQDRVSTVRLLTDTRSRAAAAISGEGQLIGVLEGRGNGAMALTYVPSSQPLQRDQMIVTAGTEPKVQANLPFGVVNVVEGSQNDPFLTAAVEPLVNVKTVVYVSILRPAALAPNL